MPEVSVIVPVYKVEKYLRRCLDSILAQTFKDFELLLIDDGSPDNSGAICDEYAAKDSRVKVFHKENGGVSSARNLGLDYAQGKYIMFCDSDDYVADAWIEKLYQLIIKDEVDLALCGYYLTTSHSNTIVSQKQFSVGQNLFYGGEIFWQLKEKGLLCQPWNKIYKAKVIEKAKLRFELGLQLGEDELFVLSYLKETRYRFGVSNDFLCYYTYDVAGSLTHRYVPNLWNNSKKIMLEERAAIARCGIELQDFSESFNSAWLWSVIHSVQNNMMKESSLSFGEMLKQNHEILNGDEAKQALSNSDYRVVTPLYKSVLKTRSALLVWLFHKAVQLKHKIIPDK